MMRKVTDSFYIDLDDFEELVVCSTNVRDVRTIRECFEYRGEDVTELS